MSNRTAVQACPMDPRAYLGMSTSRRQHSEVDINESFSSPWLSGDCDTDAGALNVSSHCQHVKSHMNSSTPDGPAGVS